MIIIIIIIIVIIIIITMIIYIDIHISNILINLIISSLKMLIFFCNEIPMLADDLMCMYKVKNAISEH